jgi:hypothetical protein
LRKPGLPKPIFNLPAFSASSSVSTSVTFQEDDANVSVSGFTAGDLNITGASVSNFSGSGHTYTFTLTPSAYPVNVSVSIASGAATASSSGSPTAANSASVEIREAYHKSGNLVFYMPFDEGSGTTANLGLSPETDTLSGHFLTATLHWTSVEDGATALQFDGNGGQTHRSQASPE